MDGSIYVWSGNELQETLKPSNGPLYSITKINDQYIICGKFAHVSVWSTNFEQILQVDLGTVNDALEYAFFRSVDLFESELLLGSAQSEIVTYNTETQELSWVTRGHAEGELWGVARHPETRMACTASDDKSLRVWDLEQRELKSITYLDFSARSCAFSTDGSQIAVGMKTGQLQVFSAETFEIVKSIEDRKQDSLRQFLSSQAYCRVNLSFIFFMRDDVI